MLSDNLQDLILGIVPDTETLSGMFGAYQQHELDRADRALDVIMKSIVYDHEDWHKKNDGECPGMWYFGLRAIKGYLLSHADDLTDEEALGIYSMVLINLTENVGNGHHEHEDPRKEKLRKRAAAVAKLANSLGVDIPDKIQQDLSRMGVTPEGDFIEDANVVTDEHNIVDRFRTAIYSEPAQKVIARMRAEGYELEPFDADEIKNRLGADLGDILASPDAELSEEQFNAFIGVSDNAPVQEKLFKAIGALASFPLPNNVPDEVKEKLTELQEELREQIAN